MYISGTEFALIAIILALVLFVLLRKKAPPVPIGLNSNIAKAGLRLLNYYIVTVRQNGIPSSSLTVNLLLSMHNLTLTEKYLTADYTARLFHKAGVDAAFAQISLAEIKSFIEEDTEYKTNRDDGLGFAKAATDESFNSHFQRNTPATPQEIIDELFELTARNQVTPPDFHPTATSLFLNNNLTSLEMSAINRKLYSKLLAFGRAKPFCDEVYEKIEGSIATLKQTTPPPEKPVETEMQPIEIADKLLAILKETPQIPSNFYNLVGRLLRSNNLTKGQMKFINSRLHSNLEASGKSETYCDDVYNQIEKIINII